MSIFENIKRIFKKENEKEIVKKLAESYQEKKEKGEEHPIDSTIAKIMNIINESNNPDETAKRILTAALENNQMPDRIPEKLSIIISKDPTISDSVISNAVEQSNTEVPDKVIDNIIKEGKVRQEDRDRLIKNVDDEGIIHSRIKNEFLILYKTCKDKRDDEVSYRIQELKDLVKQSNIDMDIQELIENVISKKMAENIYDDIKKSTKIYNLGSVLSPIQMFERDIAVKAENEFRIIEKQRGKKPDRFKKEDLEKQILLEIARNTGYKYKETGKIFIHQSPKMRKISNENEEDFIRIVESSSGKELKREDILEIKGQIRGSIQNEETKDEIFLETIKELPDKEKNISMLTEIVGDEQKVKTLDIMNQCGLLEELSTIPFETRQRTIGLIKESIATKKEQLSKDKTEQIEEER